MNITRKPLNSLFKPTDELSITEVYPPAAAPEEPRALRRTGRANKKCFPLFSVSLKVGVSVCEMVRVPVA
jgi:hypothetical protein